MRNCHRFALGGFAATALLAAPVPTGEHRQDAARAKAQLPDAYIENRGQWDAQAQFLAKAPGVNVWITETGVVYDFYKAKRAPADRQSSITNRQSRVGHIVRMEFVGGKPSATRGEGAASSPYNFLLGSDKSKWVLGAKGFEAVCAENVYDGVQARYYYDRGLPRYDLIVAPGVNPAKIAMRFIGADSLSVKDGALQIGTSVGTAKHQGLFAFQRTAEGVRQVPCALRAEGNIARFQVGEYDRTRPLTIDPLLIGTFVGGGSDDFVNAMDVNLAGKPTVIGQTASNDFPATAGAYDTIHNGGTTDAFIFKLNATMDSLQMCTFVGGSGSDGGAAVAVDESGNTYAAINTASSDFPTTSGAFDRTLNGGTDVAVIKIDGSSNLVFSSFVGGSSTDLAKDLVLFGNKPVVCGQTDSPNFPTTLGAFQAAALGTTDGFVFNLSATGALLPHSTYLGGAGIDSATHIRRRNNAEWVLIGTTASTNFPTTAGAFQTVNKLGPKDFFVCRMDDNFGTLIKSTYLGGIGDEVVGAVACPGTGRDIYVGGTSGSGDMPTTVGSFSQFPTGSSDEAVVFRLSPSLGAVNFGTYLGGNSADGATAIGVDQFNNVIVAGNTSSPNFPTTAPKTFDGSANGLQDAFVFKFNPNLASMAYSTYLGAAQTDAAYALEVDADGNTFVAGDTDSPFFPRTAGSFDTVHNGGQDAFVVKVATAPAMFVINAPTSMVGGFTFPFQLFLTQKAPPGGTTVELSTNNLGKVLMPATTLVKEDRDSKTVNVGTESVTVDTDVIVFATCNSITLAKTITLKPGGLASIKLGTTMQDSTVGAGFVNLTGPAPAGGRVVTLTSSNPSKLQMPASVTVPATLSSQSFSVTASSVASNTNVTVTAKLGSMVKADTITILP